MSTLWVLSGLIRTLVLLSTMSTPGSCMTDYTVIRITAGTGPTNPRVIVTIHSRILYIIAFSFFIADKQLYRTPMGTGRDIFIYC